MMKRKPQPPAPPPHREAEDEARIVRSPYFSPDVGRSSNSFQPDSQPGVGGRRLELSDYSLPCQELAKSLLGKVLCRQLAGSKETLRAVVVEVESYPGASDGASHSFRGQTERNRAMFMEPGTAYVYSIYGVYHCFNVSSQGEGAAVLIRSLQPLQGLRTMRTNREARRKAGAKVLKEKDLCNGPSKLCQAFNIDKTLNCSDLTSSHHIWFEEAAEAADEDVEIVETKRVGIEGCGQQWASLPLRWYIKGNPHVSVRDKQAESQTN